MVEQPTWIEASPTDLAMQESKTVFLLNAWCLPLWLSYRNRRRQRKLVAHLKKHVPDYVFLQEMWCSHDVNWLEKQMTEYQLFRSGQKHQLINKGGLVTLIKSAKVHKPVFEPFEKPQGGNLDEMHAGKGVLLVTSSSGLTLGNTHLYSPGTDGAVFTETQFRKILERGEVYSQFIMAGDYNLPFKRRAALNEAYGSPFKIFETNTTYDSVINPLTRKRVNRFVGNSGERSAIDGLMVRGDGIKLRYSGVFRTPLLSDHYGVVGLLSLNNSIRNISF